MDKIQYTLENGGSNVVPVFNGRTIDIMPQLVSSGYTPISVAQIMEQRILAWQSGNCELAKLWGNNYFDSGDSIIYYPDGKIKVLFDSENLKNINHNTLLKLTETQLLKIDNIEGKVFSKTDIKRFANIYLKQENVLKNPIWLALARDNKQLLKEYSGQIYSRIKETYLMKIWVRNSSNFQIEKFWSLDALSGNSIVYGNSNGLIDSRYGRIIGIPKILEDKLN